MTVKKSTGISIKSISKKFTDANIACLVEQVRNLRYIDAVKVIFDWVAPPNSTADLEHTFKVRLLRAQCLRKCIMMLMHTESRQEDWEAPSFYDDYTLDGEATTDMGRAYSLTFVLRFRAWYYADIDQDMTMRFSVHFPGMNPTSSVRISQMRFVSVVRKLIAFLNRNASKASDVHDAIALLRVASRDARYRKLIQSNRIL